MRIFATDKQTHTHTPIDSKNIILIIYFSLTTELDEAS